MSEQEDDTNDLNLPNMDQVAYEVAIETIAKMYKDLRKAKLSRADAAAVVAYILKSDEGLNA